MHSQSNHTYSIRLLGKVEVEYQGQVLENIALQKVRALLGYLACQPHEVGREQLATLLWEGWPIANARRNLSRAVYQISQALPGCLEATRGDHQNDASG